MPGLSVFVKLLEVLVKLLGPLFIWFSAYKSGDTKAKLVITKEQIENAKKQGKLKNDINNLPDDDINDIVG